MVPTHREGAVKAAYSTKDLFAMMKTVNEKLKEIINRMGTYYKHRSSDIALVWQESRRRTHGVRRGKAPLKTG